MYKIEYVYRSGIAVSVQHFIFIVTDVVRSRNHTNTQLTIYITINGNGIVNSLEFSMTESNVEDPSMIP